MRDATPVLKLFTRARVAWIERLDPEATQQRLLMGLLRTARDTRFGRAHGFGAIRSVAEFQQRVPLRRYEAFWRDWWQPDFPTLRDATWPGPIPYFALSSGTTSGTTKYIPVTAAQMAANRGAALDTLAWHLARQGAGAEVASPSPARLQQGGPGHDLRRQTRRS